LGTENDRFQPGGAYFVNSRADSCFAQTSSNGTLTGRVLAQASCCEWREKVEGLYRFSLCRQYIAEKHFLNLTWFDSGYSLNGGWLHCQLVPLRNRTTQSSTLPLIAIPPN
jgi:hypothetical protein